MTRYGLVAVLALTLSGCKADTEGVGSGESGSSGGTGITSLTSSSASSTSASTSGATTTADDSGGTTAGPGDTSAGADTSAGDSMTTEPTTGGGSGGDPISCDGTEYACGDGMDNDGDGKTDLQDPECTGPCDDDESSFQTGIPGDNMDCKQDCFFDGNSGQGDDGCIWDLKCDPENPGEFINCEYSGGNNCNNMPPNQDPDCIMFCEQFVPPGCDCFGCCEVCDENGENCVNIFLGGGDDCSFDNLDACTSCSPQIDECGNPCVPEECEVCFGQDEPPEGCGPNECDNGLPCVDNGDCPTDFYCLLSCCYPPPPG